MSSVFLYVAIVAIWAFVLVPRWLRRHHGQPVADVDDGAYPDAASEEQYEDYRARPAADGYGYIAPVARRQPLPRTRMLQARRRLLTTLLVLTAAMAGCVAVRIVPWWACVPPAGVLCVYVLLLREAARADAEQAWRAAAAARGAGLRAAARQQALADDATASAQPSAEIIDISARVADQLYDQYADATERAVGD